MHPLNPKCMHLGLPFQARDYHATLKRTCQTVAGLTSQIYLNKTGKKAVCHHGQHQVYNKYC